MDHAIIAGLVRSRVYCEFAASFREAFGMSLYFAPVAGSSVPLNEAPGTGAHDRVAAAHGDLCRATSREAPVKMGGHVIGFLWAESACTRKPREIWRVRRVRQHESAMRLLRVFAELLEMCGNPMLVARDAGENPAVARARSFIAENAAEDIGLADCAREAHMSRFYFCKVFKRCTGLAFSEYLSRVRTENAKACLANPHVRVSEVAFEVGFQSLSQFNRTFKNLTGSNPTEFRRSLPSFVGRPERADFPDDSPAPRVVLAQNRTAWLGLA